MQLRTVEGSPSRAGHSLVAMTQLPVGPVPGTVPKFRLRYTGKLVTGTKTYCTIWIQRVYYASSRAQGFRLNPIAFSFPLTRRRFAHAGP